MTDYTTLTLAELKQQYGRTCSGNKARHIFHIALNDIGQNNASANVFYVIKCPHGISNFNRAQVFSCDLTRYIHQSYNIVCDTLGIELGEYSISIYTKKIYENRQPIHFLFNHIVINDPNEILSVAGVSAGTIIFIGP